MKRIHYLAHQFPVITETFTVKEVDGLAAEGLDVRVAALRPAPTDVPQALARRAAAPIPLGPAAVAAVVRGLVRRPQLLVPLARGRRSRRLLAFTRGASLAGGLGPGEDHVHAQFPLEASNAALFAAALSGCSFSFSGHTYHDLELMDEKLAAATFVTVGSEFERGLLCGRYGERWRPKIAVSRLGVPPRSLRGAARPGQIVSVGTLTGKKGHDVLVRAVAELVRRGRAVELDIVGEGPQRAVLERLAADLGVSGLVRLRGALAHEDTLDLIGAAAAFALACVCTPEGDHDCLPVALMDAMSLGVPCVSSDAFGIPELIEDGVTGLLAPPGEPVAVADRLERLLADPEGAERTGRMGRESVRERYDLDRNVRGLALLFRERLG